MERDLTSGLDLDAIADALDVVGACVMIADDDLVLRYVKRAAKAKLTELGPSIEAEFGITVDQMCIGRLIAFTGIQNGWNRYSRAAHFESARAGQYGKGSPSSPAR